VDKETEITGDWGDRLRALREARGWKQRDLAHRTGRSQARISQIEQGRDNVRLATLVNLLEALGYELVALPKDHLSAIKQIFPESVTAGAVVGTPQISQGKPSTLLHEISVPDPDDDEDEEKPGQIGPAGR
jgi:transcriptional regulator with XRE-family HTH domain